MIAYNKSVIKSLVCGGDTSTSKKSYYLKEGLCLFNIILNNEVMVNGIKKLIQFWLVDLACVYLLI